MKIKDSGEQERGRGRKCVKSDKKFHLERKKKKKKKEWGVRGKRR